MHAHLYFAVAALAASPALSDTFKDLAWSGEFRALARQLGAAIDAGRSSDQDDQAHADLQLIFGRYDEADRLYRDTLSRVASDQNLLCLMSWRHAAWQSLFLHRHRTALDCFRRILQDEQAAPALRLESWLGLALVMFQVGQLSTAWDCSERLMTMSSAHEQSRWIPLTAALRRDLSLQLRMRASDGLIDHVLWHSLVTEARLPPDDSTPSGTHELTGVLKHYSAFQRHLCALVDGNRQFMDQIEGYAYRASELGMSEYHRFVRVDIALAALAGGALDVTQRMLDAFGEADPSLPRGGHWMLDHLYCEVSVLRWQGRRAQGDAHYRRYCVLAIQRARGHALTLNVFLPLHVRHDNHVPGDDISVRLVGKYRRAYKFIIENLDRPKLSVKEVAAHIGVTDRALQLAMRSSLGMSPTQLIRRLRMERIRDDLLGSGLHKGIFAIAEKWGVRHRSSLAIAYRREYDESPSDTMLRSET